MCSLPHPLTEDACAMLELVVQALDGAAEDAEGNGAILALTAPPAACPGCLADAGVAWPSGMTSAFCPTHLSRLAATRRRVNVSRWSILDRSLRREASKR